MADRKRLTRHICFKPCIAFDLFQTVENSLKMFLIFAKSSILDIQVTP